MTKKKNSNKILFMGAGTGMLIAGIALVLAWWPQVVSLFKGFIPMALAVGGLVVLYLIKD